MVEIFHQVIVMTSKPVLRAVYMTSSGKQRSHKNQITFPYYQMEVDTSTQEEEIVYVRYLEDNIIPKTAFVALKALEKADASGGRT